LRTISKNSERYSLQCRLKSQRGKIEILHT
jgi:hypothetical protein